MFGIPAPRPLSAIQSAIFSIILSHISLHSNYTTTPAKIRVLPLDNRSVEPRKMSNLNGALDVEAQPYDPKQKAMLKPAGEAGTKADEFVRGDPGPFGLLCFGMTTW